MIEPVNIQSSLSQVEGEKTVKRLKSESGDLRDVANQFEAIFLNQFLKEARKVKLAEDPLFNSASKTYRDMLDQQYATELSANVDLGIAEGLMRQFGKLVE